MQTTLVKNLKGIVPTQLSVDFPRQNEVVNSKHYTLRLTAPENVRKVEIAIDGGEWMPCREASGYWWHDWSSYEDGEHEIIASIETQEGRRITSEPHEFYVDIQPKPSIA